MRVIWHIIGRWYEARAVSAARKWYRLDQAAQRFLQRARR